MKKNDNRSGPTAKWARFIRDPNSPQAASTVEERGMFVFGNIYRAWFILFLITFVHGMIYAYRTEERIVYSKTHTLPPLSDAVAPTAIFTEPLFLKARQNIQVHAQTAVENSWAWVGGDFIHEATGVVHEFQIPVEYYYGVENSESWSEGGTRSEVTLSAVAEGQYVLRLEFDWEQRATPMSMKVTVMQDVPRMLNWMLALLGLTVFPLCLFFYEMKIM